MEIDISIEHGDKDISDIDIRGLCEFVMQSLNLDNNSEVSITFVNNDTIADLNSKYRGIIGPTDVLSFEQDNMDDDFVIPGTSLFLGDVIIAPDIAKKQAQEFGQSFQEEIEMLLVHGLLHLNGYDHIEDDEAEIMQNAQDKLLYNWRHDKQK